MVYGLAQKQFLTEFDGSDGCRYAGPIVLADCLAAAKAIVLTCLRGPTGQPIMILGEVVYQTDGPANDVTVRIMS